MSTVTDNPEVIARCSFCQKANTEIRKLVAGDGVFICDECVALCAQIISEELAHEVISQELADEGISEELTEKIIAKELAEDWPKSAGSPVAPWEKDVPLEDLLPRLSKVAAAQARADENLHLWVAKARSLGATWRQLGEALGMTRQSAWERFSGEE
jgi:hypothetical protein